MSANPERFGKIYLPIRAKKGQSGRERFEGIQKSILGSIAKSCVYCESSAPIPADTNIVILNAYSISFMGDVKDTLEQNVVPMLDLLKQCTELVNLSSVLIVSTAYVQPYLPFKLCKGPIPCHAAKDPQATFNAVLDGSITWEQIKADPLNHQHTSVNAYVYSKTLLEHLVLQLYEGLLPLVIFRPSMISVSSDGKVGSMWTPPCATALLAQSKVARVFPGTACADHVYVDKASELLLKSVQLPREQLLQKAQFVLATGNSAVKPQIFENEMRGSEGCCTVFMSKRWFWVIPLLRAVELLMYRLVLGAKMASRIGKVYQNYDHFLTHSFDFEPNLPIDVDEYHKTMSRWLVANPMPVKQSKPKGSIRCGGQYLNLSESSMKWSMILLPVIFSMCCIMLCMDMDTQ